MTMPIEHQQKFKNLLNFPPNLFKKNYLSKPAYISDNNMHGKVRLNRQKQSKQSEHATTPLDTQIWLSESFTDKVTRFLDNFI